MFKERLEIKKEERDLFRLLQQELMLTEEDKGILFTFEEEDKEAKDLAKT